MIVNFLCSSRSSLHKMITFSVSCVLLSLCFSDLSTTGTHALSSQSSNETETSGLFEDSLCLDGGKELGWDTSKWNVQVDGVMGGKSSGFLTFLYDKNSNDNKASTMKFTGDINLNGGGFSSVRKYNFGKINLSTYSGIVVEVQTTDAYKADDESKPPLAIHLQLHDATSYYGYASAFAIPLTEASGETTSIYLPIQSFDRGSRMGFVCSSCDLDITTINEMDVYVLFQKGPFDVRFKSITAVKTPPSLDSGDAFFNSFVMNHHPVITISTKDEIKELITKTISSGGSLYDYGYRELCIAMYKSTLHTLLLAESQKSSDIVTDAVRGMICQGLERISSKSISDRQVQDSKTDTAWNLRYTLDGILEELGFADPDKGNGWRPSNTNTNPKDSFSLYYANNTCTNIPLLASTILTVPSRKNETRGIPFSSPCSDSDQNTFKDDNKKTNGIIAAVCIATILVVVVVVCVGFYVAKNKNKNTRKKTMATIHEDFDTINDANMKKEDNCHQATSLVELL